MSWKAGLLILALLGGGLARSEEAARRQLELVDIAPADLQDLRQNLPQLFTDPTLETMDEAVRALMLEGRYENVVIERRGEDSFAIVARPLRLVEEVKFTGNKSFNSGELRDLVDIRAGDRFERKKAVSAGEKIKQFYGENGFFNAMVELSFLKSEKNNMVLSFDIKELSTTRIERIDLETANPFLKKRLFGKIRNRLQKPLTVERVRGLMNEINSFLIENRYLVAEVSGPNPRYNTDKTEAYLQIEIREPYRWEFFFDGHKYETLAGLYRALDFRNHERKNLEPASEGAERLKQHYLAIGFANIQVETQVRVIDESWLKRVTYTLQEGPRVKIDRLEVQGRISRPSKYYADFVRDNSTDLISRGYYNRQDLEVGFKNLETELRNQGYLRARVQSSRTEYSRNKSKVVVSILMDEGQLTQIRAVDFEGNRFLSSSELAAIMKLNTNQPLRLNQLEDSIETLKNHYRNSGFLEMKLLNEGEDLVQYNEKGTQARLYLKIFEGPRIRISSVQVEGNTFTHTRVILKEADFKEGEILTPKKIEDASTRLNRLGIFSRADIHTIEENTNVSDRTLLISVTERDPGTFRFGVGINDERRLTTRGFMGLSYNNLFGTARAVSTRVELKNNVSEVKYPENEVSVGYLEPFIFNSRFKGRVNWTRSDRVFAYTSENRVTSITRSNKFDLFLERDFTSHVRFTWRTLSLDFIRAFERYNRCVDVKTNRVIPGPDCPTNQQVGTIGPILDVDYRDNPFLPTSGFWDRLSLDYSDPVLGSTKGIQFVKLENTFTHYTRVGSAKVVWANSLRGGYLSNLSHDPVSGVPASQAFFLGGLFTVRGFDSSSDQERIPPAWQLPFNESTDLIIKNDSTYGLLKSELRFPLAGEHGGVVFYDGGFVRVSGYKFDRPYRDSIGVGYRYNTPVGPVALDFAFKIRPRTETGHEENPFRFHFSIGTF